MTPRKADVMYIKQDKLSVIVRRWHVLPCILFLAVGLGAVRPAQAGSSFKVGSFTKTTAGAPTSQVVAHGLGETPKALILWTNGKTNESFSGNMLFGFGMTDGGTDKSTATSSQDGTTGIRSMRLANMALTIVQWDGTLLAEAGLTSWDATNFTLNWTVNDGNADVIHFIAIGGSDISAKVLGWTMNTTTGDQSVTGVGFRPNVVIHAHLGSGFTTAPPATNSTGGLSMGLGVMDASGDEWAVASRMATVMSSTMTSRGQQTDACIYWWQANGFALRKEASFVSMDSDGFTVNWSTANTKASQVVSLALKGLNVKAGSFAKTTAAAPVSQAVTGGEFQPNVVLLASFQDVTQASPVTEARFGLGASDGTTEGSSAFQGADAANPTSVDGIDKTSKVFVKVDNSTPGIDAEADLTSLDSDGFTLNWTTNDGVATEMLYLAFGSLSPTAVDLTSFHATHHQGGVLLRWHAGLDVNNLGWHVYREMSGERVRLTPELIAGSALMYGPGIQLNAGNSYRWWDPAGRDADRYWIEDRDLSGKRTMHGPVTPVVTDQPLPRQRHSTLLSQVKREQTSRTKTRAPLARSRVRHQSRTALAPLVTSPQTPPLWETPDLPPHDVQRHLAAAPAVQLLIRESGFYRVTQPSLALAGLSASVDPRRLQLFVDGQQQAIIVRGEEDGRFDPHDAIEFYGVALDTPWTDTHTYWLVAGSQPGHRMPVESIQTLGTPSPQSFPATVAHQERSLYLAMVRNGEAENFFGAVVAEEPVERVLSLHHLDPAPPTDAQLEVVLQGVTPDSHQVSVQLGGEEVGTLEFLGQTRKTVAFPIPQIWLQNGETVVTLVPIGDPDDISVVDRIQLTYWHTYAADDDTLRFSVPSHRQVVITGFSQPDVRVVDITHSQVTREWRGAIVPQGEGYAMRVTPGGEADRTLFAFTNAQVKAPAAIMANAPSTWHQDSQGADLVIISHGEFLESVMPLKSVREAQGWRVVLVDVEDVYDEFNFGHKSPWALRHFLHQASTAWQPPPRFVLLVGDASFDSRNYLELDDVDFVPTQFVETAFLETASDDALVDFDDDGVPELAVGRLPVQTVEEATTVVAKLVGYAAVSGAGQWAQEALLVQPGKSSYAI